MIEKIIMAIIESICILFAYLIGLSQNEQERKYYEKELEYYKNEYYKNRK